MKKILVPIDFSPASRNAAEYAAILAQEFSAEIYLLHVFMEPMPVSEAPVAWMITGSELQDANNELVKQEVDNLKKKYNLKIDGSALAGYKGDTIHDFAEKQNIDLIIMGMKSGKKSKFIGSTALTTIRKVDIPVLIIPENVTYAPIKHIVLASDFNETSRYSCFDLLFMFIERYNSSMKIFHVRKKGVEMAVSEVPGKIQLGHLFTQVTFEYQDVEDEDVEHGILNYVKSHPADLLAMVAHRHNIFERVFGTVHTRTISFETQLPLLVLTDK